MTDYTIDEWPKAERKARERVDKAQQHLHDLQNTNHTQDSDIQTAFQDLYNAEKNLQDIRSVLPLGYQSHHIETSTFEEWQGPKTTEVALAINGYLSAQQDIVVSNYTERLGRCEWEIQLAVCVDGERNVEKKVIGILWVQGLTEKGEVKGVRYGYGPRKDEFYSSDLEVLKMIFLGGKKAVELEFGIAIDGPLP